MALFALYREAILPRQALIKIAHLPQLRIAENSNG